MKISIKYKFSLFLTGLLLLVVVLLSIFVMGGIRSNQVDQYEAYLAKQGKTANTYFLQTLLLESNKSPNTFLQEKGSDFSKKLELIIGLSLGIYNSSGDLVSGQGFLSDSANIKKTLDIALGNKTAYLVEGSSLYYMTPLLIGDEQVGVLRFNYSLADYQEFYEDIKQLFILIGAVVFVLSFLLGNVFYNSFANSIISLDKTVDKIKAGYYETHIIKRRDEIGRLSLGIHHMSKKIKETISGMEEEQSKLRLAVDKLSRLDKQQKEFIGNVTHEFKTPLTSIKAYLDLLEMYPEDKHLLETSMANIRSETNRLYDMVDKVLGLSALEKYDFELTYELIDVRQELTRILNSLKGRMDKLGISLNTQLDEAYIRADRDSLTIVLINLLDNAIKYNKEDGGITVKSYDLEDCVHIEISDTGIGIPSNQVEKVFEPFYMVDKNRSREVGGAGLGLSLSRKYTELMGGSLKLLHTGEEGTSFRVTFPKMFTS